MGVLSALPALMDALDERATGLHRLAGVRARPRSKDRRVPTSPPNWVYGNWFMPVGMARSVATGGRVRLADGGASLVVFRDHVAVMQETGWGAWVRPLAVAVEGDLEADPDEIVWRAGASWFSIDRVRSLKATWRTDHRGRLLRRRLTDLLSAEQGDETRGLGFIHVERATFKGDSGYVQVCIDATPGRMEFMERVASHAVRCAGPTPLWELRRDHPFPHLSASWMPATRVQRVIAPALLPSAVLRARAPRAAALRTLEWLRVTGAPDDLVGAAEERVSGDAPSP